MNIQVQYLENNGQPAFAVIPVADYRLLLELAEDAEDTRAADAAMNSDDELIDGSVVEALINGENPVKVWRTYRGLTQDALAKKNQRH